MNRATLVTLAVLVLGVSGAYGLDWNVDSLTAYEITNEPSPPALFSEELLGSLQVPFDHQGSGLDVKAHTTAEVPASWSGDFDVLAFRFAFLKPVKDLEFVKLSLGRVTLSDPTGLIINHPGDGFQVGLNYGGLDLLLSGGYTGLVNRISSEISLTRADQNNSANYLASPRLVGALDASMVFFDTQKFTLSALAQKDLNASSSLISAGTQVQSTTQGGALDTQYFTLKAEGPIVQRLFYGAFATLGTGSTLSWVSDSSSSTGYSYKYEPIASFLFGGSLSYFIPDWLNSSFTGRIVAASGDGSATSVVEGNVSTLSTLFLPITPTTLGLTFNPGLSNLIEYELGATVKPIPGSELVTGAKVLGFQKALQGVVNASGVLTGGPLWMGEEFDLTAGWPVFSDLDFTAGAGFFVPTAGTFASGTVGATFQYSLEMSVRLSL